MVDDLDLMSKACREDFAASRESKFCHVEIVKLQIVKFIVLLVGS